MDRRDISGAQINNFRKLCRSAKRADRHLSKAKHDLLDSILEIAHHPVIFISNGSDMRQMTWLFDIPPKEFVVRVEGQKEDYEDDNWNSKVSILPRSFGGTIYVHQNVEPIYVNEFKNRYPSVKVITNCLTLMS